MAANEDNRDLVALLEEAVQYVDEVLTPEREKATDYYLGRPFGNEEQGRSQVVITTVRDTVHAILPSLIRVFLGPERTVEFRPRGPEDIAEAKQKTVYVNYVVNEDNDGFIEFHSAFKDAMIRKLGIWKYWWDESHREEGVSYEGLTEEDLALLEDEESVKEVEVTGYDEETDLISAEVIRDYDESCARFMAVPPEEFLFTPAARSLDDSLVLAHRRLMRKSEIVAMGYDEGVFREVAAGGDSLRDNPEQLARQPAEASSAEGANEQVDPKYLYVEAFMRDGRSWRKYCTLGPAFKVLNGEGKGEPTSEPPFAVLCPDPEPHSIVGQSTADLTMDLQRLESAIMRGTVDSLGLAIMPRTEVVENEVNLRDVMNPELGGVVRVRRPGMMREVTHRFVGQDTLPTLEYIQSIRESRTGQTKAAAGLDADALQSSTKAAVAATLTAAQQRIELLARVFAETGVKRLFQGLARLLAEHQDRERVIRLTNGYVPVDPRTWNSNMDVSVNVALGVGTSEEKMGMLQGIAAKQEAILERLGPVNPLVTLEQYRNTMARMIELGGFSNSAEFFLPVDQEDMKKMAESANQKQPSPEEILAQAQMKISEGELELKREDMLRKDDRERDAKAADIALKEKELELKYNAEIAKEELRVQAQANRQNVMGAPDER